MEAADMTRSVPRDLVGVWAYTQDGYIAYRVVFAQKGKPPWLWFLDGAAQGWRQTTSALPSVLDDHADWKRLL